MRRRTVGISSDQSHYDASRQSYDARAFNRCALINSTILGARVDGPGACFTQPAGRTVGRRAGVDDGRMSPWRRPAALRRQHRTDDSATVYAVV